MDDLAATTIPDVLRLAARRWPHTEALVDGHARMTFAELGDAVTETGRALIASGVEAGDRVAIWAPNVHEWVLAALGTYAVGAAVVPLNTRFKGTEAAHVLRTSKARLLFTVTDFLDTDYVALLDGQPDIGCVTETVVLRGPLRPSTVSWTDFLARGDAVPGSAVADREAAVAPDDMSDILFTSGTTGAPKGAMLSHEASVRAYTAWTDVIGLRAGDRYLIINPFFHAFGLKAGILACLLTGATMVPHLVFDVPSVMARIPEERITMLPGPPAIYQTILNHPDLHRFDLSSLRLAVTGAASVPVELVVAIREVLRFETVVTGYGLTESTGIVTMCRHDDDPVTIATTSGRAIPGVEVRLVDDRGDTVAPGSPGEIVVRGYNVMKGVYGDPAATAEAIDADGWLHTGDVAVQDEAGNVRITDRKKDMFINGGFNAYPAEIEGIMAQRADLAQIAVVGVPDERMGEVGMAFVVPKIGATVDPAELVTWCRANMANYKAPKYVHLVESMPLNASGKVMKFELRRLADSLLSRPTS